MLKRKFLITLCIYNILAVLLVIINNYGLDRDFCQDYIAASRFIQGKTIYSSLKCIGAIEYFSFHYNSHPPTSILFFTPFAYLSINIATILWIIISLIAYFTAGALLLKALKLLSFKSFLIFISCSLFWPVFHDAIKNQNLSQLLLLLLVASWVLQKKKQDNWSGVLIGFAGLLKLWPAILLIGAFLTRKTRLAITGSIVLIAGTIISIYSFGIKEYVQYTGAVREHEYQYIAHPRNVSITGVIARLATGFPHRGLSQVLDGIQLHPAIYIGQFIGVVIMFLTLLFIWRHYPKVPPEGKDLLIYGLLITVTTLTFPISWLWGLIVILLPFSLLILATQKMSRRPQWLLFMLALNLILFIFPYVVDNEIYLIYNLNPSVKTLLSILPTINLILFALLQAVIVLYIKKVKPNKAT